MKYIKAFFLGSILGLVLAAIFAFNQILHGQRCPSPIELTPIIAMVVVAALILTALDGIRYTRSNSFRTETENPPSMFQARVCADAYSPNEFVCWRPVHKAVDESDLKVERVLEHKTWSFHRAVLFAKGDLKDASLPENFQSALRAWCKRELCPSRMKGLGVGCVVESNGDIIPSIEKLALAVDRTSKFPATIQWLIWFDAPGRRAIGVHTHTDVLTTRCFEALCQYLKEQEYVVNCQRCDAPAILKMARAITVRSS